VNPRDAVGTLTGRWHPRASGSHLSTNLAGRQRYTPTGLVKTILAKVGKPVGNAPGPDYWLLPSGRSMYEESKLAETSLERPIADGSE
jgi:hypothetical protein